MAAIELKIIFQSLHAGSRAWPYGYIIYIFMQYKMFKNYIIKLACNIKAAILIYNTPMLDVLHVKKMMKVLDNVLAMLDK